MLDDAQRRHPYLSTVCFPHYQHCYDHQQPNSQQPNSLEANSLEACGFEACGFDSLEACGFDGFDGVDSFASHGWPCFPEPLELQQGAAHPQRY